MNAVNDRAAWLTGTRDQCSVQPIASDHAYRLVLLGPPGVGKGTQAEMLSKGLHACHLSTGDVFRSAKGNTGMKRSTAMNDAVTHMQKGDLVPDVTVLSLIRERRHCLRCTGGFLLDGFPRTVEQAQALERILRDEGMPLHAVIYYELPTSTIISRLSERRTCITCKAVYHLTQKPPATSDVCDTCGGPVKQREDDKPEVIQNRMEAYEAITVPLIDFYRKRSLLVSVSADGTPGEIYQRTLLGLSGQKWDPNSPDLPVPS